MDYYKIGQNIRKFRKAKGLSQDALAEAIGISVTHMSHIETANTKLSLPVFIAIAEALDVQTDDLLRDEVSGRRQALDDLSEILNSCTSQQIRIITDIIKTVKSSLDKYA